MGSTRRRPRRRRSRRRGYDGVMAAETSHDPFLPLLLAAQSTERVDLIDLDRGGVRPQPHDAGPDRVGPAGGVGRAVRPRPRQPDQAAHHPPVLDAVVTPCGPHARDDPGHPRHLGVLERRHQARLPRRLLHPHADDAVLQPGPQPARRRPHLPRRRGRADDRGGRRGGRRVHLPRVHHPALPRRGHAAPPREGARQGGQVHGRLRAHGPDVRGDRPRRGRDGEGGRRRAPADRLLRVDARLPQGARAARLGRPAGRAQPHVEGGPLGGDGRPRQRRDPRGVRRGRAPRRGRRRAERAVGRRPQPRLSFYAPYEADPTQWDQVIADLKAA